MRCALTALAAALLACASPIARPRVAVRPAAPPSPAVSHVGTRREAPRWPEREWMLRSFRQAVPLAWDHGRLALVHRASLFPYDLVAGRVTGFERGPCFIDDAFFAGSLFVVCRREAYDEVLERTPAWRPRLRFVATGYAPCVASSDGERVACMGPCADGRPSPRGACVARRGHPAQHVAWDDDGRWRVVGFRGDELVAVESADELRAMRVRIGRGAPAPLASAWPDATLRLAAAGQRLDARGAWHLTARADDGAVVVLDGVPGGAWTRRPAPPAGDAVLCGDQGVALARGDDGVPWLSEADGAPWRPLDGSRPGGRLRCDAASRFVERREAQSTVGEERFYERADGVLGWGPPLDELTPPVPPPPPAPDDPVGPRWECSNARITPRVHPDGASVRPSATEGGRAIMYEGSAVRETVAGATRTHPAPVAVERVAGVFVLDGASGVLAFGEGDGVLAVGLGGATQPLGAFPMRLCGAGARGDLRLDWEVVTAPSGDGVSYNATFHLRVDRVGLCVAGARGAEVALVPVGNTLEGEILYKDVPVAVRCVPVE